MPFWELQLAVMPGNGWRYSLQISPSIVHWPHVRVEGVFPTEISTTNGAGVPCPQVDLHDMAINALLIHECTTSHPFTIKLGVVVACDSMVIPQVGREHMPKNWQATVCSITDDPGACVRVLRSIINQLLHVLMKHELRFLTCQWKLPVYPRSSCIR